MTALIHTMNSTYEVDVENKRVRRILGINAPTPNQGEDGEWKEYETIKPFYGSLVVQWVGTTKALITSPVVSVEGSYLGIDGSNLREVNEDG